MGWTDWLMRRGGIPATEQRSMPTGPVSVSSTAFLEMLGIGSTDLPIVTVESALQVPAVSAAVTFLSRSLAALPLHLFKKSDGTNAEKVDGGLAILLRDAPNDELTSFGWRQWFWQQVFTSGRGLSWIERNGSGQIAGIWPMAAAQTRIERRNGRMLYHFQGQAQPYPASDVIDLAWMLRADGVGHYAPVQRGAKAIQSALAMMDYASRFFAKGGVPPLTLIGPPGTGADAMKRAIEQVNQAVKASAEANIPIVRLPAGFELKPVGINPVDGQMVEARKLANEDVARLYNMPPVFLQDLTHATFTNSEQQDLQLVKHLIVHWCVAFEQQLNLKLFGQRKADRQVKHNVDGLLRGDFVSRMTGEARAIQTGIMTPNEARALENLPRSEDPEADKLHMQGATVPLGESGTSGGTGNAN